MSLTMERLSAARGSESDQLSWTPPSLPRVAFDRPRMRLLRGQPDFAEMTPPAMSRGRARRVRIEIEPT